LTLEQLEKVASEVIAFAARMRETTDPALNALVPAEPLA